MHAVFSERKPPRRRGFPPGSARPPPPPPRGTFPLLESARHRSGCRPEIRTPEASRTPPPGLARYSQKLVECLPGSQTHLQKLSYCQITSVADPSGSPTWLGVLWNCLIRTAFIGGRLEPTT